MLGGEGTGGEEPGEELEEVAALAAARLSRLL